MQSQPARTVLLLLLPALALACGGKDDTGSDTAPDSPVDSSPDSPVDSNPDSGTDDTQPPDEDPAIEQCADGSTGFIEDPELAVHVWAEAEEDGDGTWARPYTSVEDALELTRTMSDDKRIAIWPGEYGTNLRLSADSGDDDTVIQGCSPDEVTLSADDAEAPVILVTEATGVEISGLCSDGGTRNIQAWGDASISLSSVCSINGAEAGVVIHGEFTQAILEDVEIISPVATKGGFGYGLTVQEGATVEMQGGGIWGATGVGVLIDDANEIGLSEVTVDGTLVDASGYYGHGLQVQADTVQVTIEASDFTANQGAGVFVLEGLGFSMSASTVSGTAAAAIPDSVETTGDGVVISRGEGNENPKWFVATIQETTVEGSDRAGIVLDGVSATVTDNVLSGNGYGEDAVLAQDSALVSGTDAVTTLPDEEALELNLAPLAAVDPGSI